MQPEEKSEITSGLIEERDKYQSLLEETRLERKTLTLSALEKMEAYTSRLGELSFVIAAAIIPVLIVSDSKIEHPIYIFAGLAIFIFVGVFSVMIQKTKIESDANSIPYTGVKIEIELQKIKNSLNKLLFEVEKREYQQEYIDTITAYLGKFGVEERKKPGVNYQLDLLVLGFVMAILISAGSVWPFSYYWHTQFTLIFAALYLSWVVLSSIKARRANEQSMQLLAELDKEKKKYLDWHSKEVLKR